MAFGVLDERLGSESIVMVAELDSSDHDRAELERELRAQIVRETEVTLADVRFVAERWVIKTSSGKLARADNRAKYFSQGLQRRRRQRVPGKPGLRQRHAFDMHDAAFYRSSLCRKRRRNQRRLAPAGFNQR